MLRSLVKDSAIYAVGTVASRLVGFMMIPVYTRVLTPADYGVIETIVRVVDIIGLILALGLAEALLRHYYLAKDEEDLRRLIGTTLSLNIGVVAVGALVVLPLSPWLTRLAFGHDRYTLYVTVSLISMLIGNFGQLPMTLWRAEGKAWRYTVVAIASLFTHLATNIILVVWLRWGVWGVVLSGLINAVVWSTALGISTWRRYGLQWEVQWLKPVLRYGLPLVPASLSQFVLHFSDRFFLTRYATEAELGLYSLAYRFGMLVSVFYGVVSMAWGPWAFRVGTQQDGESHIDRATLLIVMGFSLVGSVIILFARPTIRLLSAPDFWKAADFVPLLVMSYWAFVLQFPPAMFVRLAGRTEVLTAVVGFSAVMCLLLSLLLIPRYGAWGAAWVTLSSFAILLLTTEVVSHRFRETRKQYLPVAGGVSLLLLCTGISLKSDRWSIFWQVGASLIGTFISVGFSLLMFRLLQPELYRQSVLSVKSIANRRTVATLATTLSRRV